MKKEDVDVVAKLLSGMKDAINELEMSLKKNDAAAILAAKRKVSDLQMQINRRL